MTLRSSRRERTCWNQITFLLSFKSQYSAFSLSCPFRLGKSISFQSGFQSSLCRCLLSRVGSSFRTSFSFLFNHHHYHHPRIISRETRLPPERLRKKKEDKLYQTQRDVVPGDEYRGPSTQIPERTDLASPAHRSRPHINTTFVSQFSVSTASKK